jgi:hypothetical protein
MNYLAAITDRNASAARQTAFGRMDPAQILLHYQRVLRLLEEEEGDVSGNT